MALVKDEMSVNAEEDENESSPLLPQHESQYGKPRRQLYVEPKSIVGDSAGDFGSQEQAPDHVNVSSEELYTYSPLGFKLKAPADSQSSLVTIFVIWNTMMGTSLLSIPWGTMQSGFTMGIILIVVVGLIMLYSAYRVLQSPKDIAGSTPEYEFTDVCEWYFGRPGRGLVLAFSMIAICGALIVYWVLMSNFLYNTGKYIFDTVNGVNVTDIVPKYDGSSPVICPTPPHMHNTSLSLKASLKTFSSYWHKQKTVPFYLIVLILPLLNFPSVNFFARFNNIGTLAIFYLIILVTIKVSQLGFHMDVHWISCNDLHYVPEFRKTFPTMIGILSQAFFLHNCIITVMKNNRHQKNNVRDLSIAYGLVGGTYIYVGIFIFSTFPAPPLWKTCIQQNFLDNFPNNDILAFVARIFFLFQMITIYPLLAYILRVQLFTEIYGKTYPSLLHVLVLNIILISSGVAMARLYPQIGTIIRYVGATCSLVFVFVLPHLTHILAKWRRGTLRWYSTIPHCLLMVLGVVNFVAQFFI
uniref:neutral amino acid transporter 9-like isoform X1 n=1 Tax=Myxine glutinosa TaxID=7769 RepID=UPI00358FB59D